MKVLPRFSASQLIIIIGIAIAVWSLWLIIPGYETAIASLMQHWQIALTMTFGSVIAGGTSVGGGAIAFPVFTKLLHISPHDAKVFSLAIQSVGMGAATIAICLNQTTVEWRAIRWASLGGIFGMAIGLGFFSHWLPPDAIRMAFSIMLASFAVTLFQLNRGKRHYHLQLPSWRHQERGLFFLAGWGGGMMSGMVGNGIDIIVFSVLVLLFGLSEKVATPTAVILMAVNAIAGFAFELFWFDEFSSSVQSYWLAAIPVVVIGAPLGAIICNALSRQTIANILLVLIAVETISSMILIPMRAAVIVASLISLVLFSGFNYWMYLSQLYQANLPQPQSGVN